MKKVLNCFAVVLLIFGCLPHLSVVGFAGNTDKIEAMETVESVAAVEGSKTGEGLTIEDIKGILPCKPVVKPPIEIETVLNEATVQEIAEKRMQYELVCDKTVYLLEYNVGTKYWNNVKSFDYEGLTEQFDSEDYPDILFPMWHEFTDPKGQKSTRVVGYLRYRYNWFSIKYECIEVGYAPHKDELPLKSEYNERFWNRLTQAYYERIADYLAANDIDAKQMFMIRYPSSFSECHEVAAVIQTETDLFILDISNSVHADLDYGDNYYWFDIYSKPVLYSVEEYRTLRLEAEKEVYKGRRRLGPFFGSAGDLQGISFLSVLLFILTGVVVLSAIVFFVIRLVRKKNSKQLGDSNKG